MIDALAVSRGWIVGSVIVVVWVIVAVIGLWVVSGWAISGILSGGP